MNSIQKLTEIFSDFPGIGPRQARRFVYFLLTRNPSYIQELTRLMSDIKKNVHECSSCHQFFEQTNSQHNECDICRSAQRDNKILIIVSRDVDFENIERTHAYNGKYFILGGSVPILEKNPDQRIRSKELLRIVEERLGKDLQEIIIAMNATPEGEYTGDYVESIVRPILGDTPVKISHLGRGISTGTELEYSDSETLKNALSNRK